MTGTRRYQAAAAAAAFSALFLHAFPDVAPSPPLLISLWYQGIGKLTTLVKAQFPPQSVWCFTGQPRFGFGF